MPQPPRMEDLAALAQAGAVMPPETEARLIALRFELSECADRDPEALAQFAWVVEQGRSMADRQLQAALRLLAERQTCIELHQARDREHLAEIHRLRDQLSRATGPWWWPW